MTPSASSLGEVFAGKSSPMRQDSVDNANVEMIILPYNQDGSIYGAQFDTTEMKVIQLLHRTKPSVFFRFGQNLAEYIKHRLEEDEEFPPTVQHLEASLRCKFVYTKGAPLDEDKHNLFVPYRCAVYVQGDIETCKEMIIFLDAFIVWRIAQDEFVERPRTAAVKISILAPKGFDMKLTATEGETTGDMDCSFEVSHDETQFTKVKITDAPPPTFPSRMLVANIEAVTKNLISIVWSGNTLPFKRLFETQNIGGKVFKKNPEDKYGEYYRKKENLSIANKEEVAAVLELFGEALVRQSPVLVKVRCTPEEDSEWNFFMEQLQQLHNVFVMSR